MPESTVLDSVFGALGSMASASDRRAREGLEAAQAEEIALKNVATKKVIERNDAQELYGQIDGEGYMKTNDDGTSEVDIMSMIQKNPQLAAKFLGGKDPNRWLNHTDPQTGKPTNLTFSRFMEVPPDMVTPAAPPAAPALGAMPNQLGQQLDAAKGPTSLLPGQMPQAPAAAAAPAAAEPAAAPKRYMMILKNEKGEEVPATKLGTKDPKDPLITFSEDDLKEKGRVAKVRLDTLHGARNDITLQRQQIEFTALADEELRQHILDSGAANLDFDAAAKREFQAEVDTAEGEDLVEMANLLGIDVDKAKADSLATWTANVEAKAKNADLKPRSAYDYDATKAGLDDMVAKAQKALDDYDAAMAKKQVKSPGAKPALAGPPQVAKFTLDPTTSTMGTVDRKSQTVIALEKKYGPQMTENQVRGYDPNTRVATDSETKPVVNDPARKKLQAAVDFAKSAASNIVRPEVMDALPPGTPEPEFEWNDENVRASIRGELAQPTPEQSAALAAYGQSQGIKSAADLARIPSAKAKALMWAIATNSSGTPEEKMKMFDQLNSYAQTGDPDKSAFDANIATNAQNIDQAGVNVQRANAITAANASMYGDNLRAQQWGADQDVKAGTAAWAQSEDVVKSFNTIVNPWLKAIQEGTMEEDGQFKKIASTEARGALKSMATEISRDFTTSLSVAAQPYYAESFMKVLVAQAGEGSEVSWLWDWAKGFANMFMRTEPRETMSAIAGSWRVKTWKDGKPSEYALMEPFRDAGGKPTERTIGALELGRYVGRDAMNTMNDIIYSQRAKDELEAAGEDASPAAVQKLRRELYEADAKAGAKAAT